MLKENWQGAEGKEQGKQRRETEKRGREKMGKMKDGMALGLEPGIPTIILIARFLATVHWFLICHKKTTKEII